MIPLKLTTFRPTTRRCRPTYWPFPGRRVNRRGAGGVAAARAGTLRLVRAPLGAGAVGWLSAPQRLFLPGTGAARARARRAALRPLSSLDCSSQPGGRPLRALLRGGHLAALADPAPRAAGGATTRLGAADQHRAAGTRRLRGAVHVSKANAGERLPYLPGKLKAPRVLERLE